MVNNLPVARVDDEISCVSSTAKVKEGAQNILADNKPITHVNAESDHGGKITQGSQNVFVGPRKVVNFSSSERSWPKPSSLETCNNTPTPAPSSILGKCEYYQFRYDDFVKRHKGCAQHTPPNYYLDYGLKYCRKFSTGLYPKMDAEGKVWLPKARLLLQKSMEENLAKANGRMSTSYVDRNHPIANELNEQEFKDFALHTHIRSYWEAGLRKVSHNDIEKIAETLNLREWKDPDTWETG